MNRTQQRLENFLEQASPAQDAGLDGADVALEHFSDFFVAKAFEIAKDDGAAKDVRNLSEGMLHGNLNFVRGKLLEGIGAKVFNFDSVMSFFRLSQVLSELPWRK